MNLAAIPSPTQSAWPIAGFPIRAYALCIIAGIVVALFLTYRRWRARGGDPGAVFDIATWAVPFGLVGARLYHVITDWHLYFAPGKNPWAAFAVWEGGLGIWGAVAGGALGAWIGCRRMRISLAAFADAAAPGIVLAQALGRWGNWFNNELYGRATDVPWALTIHQIDPTTYRAVMENGEPVVIGYFHPTFLYESLWCVGVALLVLWADRRFQLGHGRAFALYVAAYTLGRAWIEWLRVDPAHEFLGFRVNDWVSVAVFLGAVGFLVATRGRGREAVVQVSEPVHEDPIAEAEAAVDAEDDVADDTPDVAEAELPASDDELDDIAVSEAKKLDESADPVEGAEEDTNTA
ncbi:MAG: prolipoprotein diacylglyceryl transferase [Streptosporangiales bacterium]|nr:prolipoprotein diacylglyceryl transferase [Streptosporangiales bacterium]